ncbi:hypothetical protein CEP53_001785 [Fusarium sp. AF-6]|nr:hypothetical protein CEP53_001785 [Fusarium sp. AF-6]
MIIPLLRRVFSLLDVRPTKHLDRPQSGPCQYKTPPLSSTSLTPCLSINCRQPSLAHRRAVHICLTPESPARIFAAAPSFLAKQLLINDLPELIGRRVILPPHICLSTLLPVSGPNSGRPKLELESNGSTVGL